MKTLRIVLTLCIAFPLLAVADDAGDELLTAARKGDLAQVKALLDKGVDVNSKSSYGQTPLFFACDRGHTEIVRLLLERGANPNVKDTFYNATALTWAADKKRLEIVQMLLAKGAEGVDMVLSSAVQAGDKAIAQAALDTGKVKQNTLDYALSMATKAKKEEFFEMLKKAGAKPPSTAVVNVPAETLAAYTGKYQGGRGGTETELKVDVKDGKLVVSNASQPSLNFTPLSQTRFRCVEYEQVEIEFKAQDGKISTMDLIQGGNAMPFTRMVAK